MYQAHPQGADGLVTGFIKSVSFLSHASEAVAAVYRSVGLGLKRNLGLVAASGADSGEELTGSSGSVLASITAGLAALGLVLEATLSVEFLLTGGEYELLSALFTDQSLVFKHCFPSL